MYILKQNVAYILGKKHTNYHITLHHSITGLKTLFRIASLMCIQRQSQLFNDVPLAK